MVGDLIKNIGGKHVEVTTLMGTGVDPHLYKATHGDLKRLRGADIIFYNGLNLEGKMQSIFEKLSKTKPTIATASKTPKEFLLESVDYVGEADPHIWFDVSLWNKTIPEIVTALSNIKPNLKDTFSKNATLYSRKLDELHLWVQKQISLIPENQRVLVTAHDAFRYFGKAYGIEVTGLQGISTASDYGLQDIQRISTLITERNIKAVFVESSVPRRFIESLQAGIIAKGRKLNIGGELFSDAMGAAGTTEGTYLGMVQHNVNTIVGALK